MILLATVLAACANPTEETVVQLIENGRFSEAQAEAKKHPAKGDELVRISAFLYHGAGITDSAILYLRKAEETTPKDPRIMLRLAEALVWKKSLAAAQDIVDAVSVKEIAKDPRPWEPAMRRAIIYVFLHELGQARNGFLMVVNDPKTPSSWTLSARVYLAQIAAWNKDFPSCIAIADSVLRGNPGHVDASLIKGQVQEWQGNYADARTTYTQALQKHPDDWQLRQRLEKLSWVK